MMIQNYDNRATIDKAIRMLAFYFNESLASQKPVLTHSLSVGFYLMRLGYDTNTVIAGLLHDIVEDTEVTVSDVRLAFGDEVADIVDNCSKKPDITDKNVRRRDVISRSTQTLNSAIVKAADIIDNYTYYTANNSQDGIDYCLENINYMKEHLPKNYKDPIFDKLLNLRG